MTKKKDKKRHLRAEAERTGKSYATVQAEDAARTSTSEDSVYDGLELWCRCVQAVGWWMFTKQTRDFFEYAESVESYAAGTMARFVKDEKLAPATVDQMSSFVAAAGRAAQKLDAAACLLNLERADVLLTQSGWVPEPVDIEDLRDSDYDELVSERLSDGPLLRRSRSRGEEPRVLSLSSDSLYRVRGKKPRSPAAGKVCRLLLFDHYVPGEAVVEYVDNNRNAVFSLDDLEEVVDPTRQARCPRCETPFERRLEEEHVDVSENEFDSLTDGQQADYFDEQESPSIGNNWHEDVIVEVCPKCGELRVPAPSA